jgi:hypothetical protein
VNESWINPTREIKTSEFSLRGRFAKNSEVGCLLILTFINPPTSYYADPTSAKIVSREPATPLSWCTRLSAHDPSLRFHPFFPSSPAVCNTKGTILMVRMSVTILRIKSLWRLPLHLISAVVKKYLVCCPCREHVVDKKTYHSISNWRDLPSGKTHERGMLALFDWEGIEVSLLECQFFLRIIQTVGGNLNVHT